MAAAGAAPWAADIFDSVKAANGGTLTGFFDVFAWREPSDVLFCEVKVGPDRIQASQRRFLARALSLRPLSEFLIIEMPGPPAKGTIRSTRRMIPATAARSEPAASGDILISPAGVAHFPGCPHKGPDPDYSRWATLSLPRAWERLGNGESLTATGGHRTTLIATSRCRNCTAHGPW